MNKTNNQSGFSAVELLITLLIAAIFIIVGYQFYAVVVKDGGEVRAQSIAASKANEYLQIYKSNASNPCSTSVQSLPANQTITVPSLTNVTLTISITCPYGEASSLSKVVSTIKYGNPQSTIISATFVKPKCLNGFIEVPGSSTYGTSDFCVMKYEAKQSSATVPISQASGVPWRGTPQPTSTFDMSQVKSGIDNDATDFSKNVVGCLNCHLITEAERMTIAQNVLNVPSNWSGGQVGSGYIYSGHNDNDPSDAIAASPNDTDGYYGTNDNASDLVLTNGMQGKSQRRTLTLTNGEVIWDFAGNLWEWSSGTSFPPTIQQPNHGIPTTYNYREWNNVSDPGTLLINASPSSTGILNAASWDSSKGIGKINSISNETVLTGIISGGYWDNQTASGVLSIHMRNIPTWSDSNFGFRVAQ